MLCLAKASAGWPFFFIHVIEAWTVYFNDSGLGLWGFCGCATYDVVAEMNE